MSDVLFGIDPGFQNLGWCRVTLTPADPWNVLKGRVDGIGVVRTEKSNAKRCVMAADDNVRRAREIYTELKKALTEPSRVRVICAESMSFPRNAGAAAKVAMTWGVLTALSQEFSLPIVQVSPQEVRRSLFGFSKSKGVSKKEVEENVLTRFPDVPARLADLGIACGLHEHVYDSLAAVIACSQSEVVRAIRSGSSC
jgi:Holliday junction resolvasome RuvABC endonuclease subunit